MCQHHDASAGDIDNGIAAPSNNNEPFPWHVGLHDAHCHPTDTMSSVALIPEMRTRTLTITATRSQDQDLVASAAKQHGVSALESWNQETCKVIPAFGWHPWFAHQLYDDTAAEPTFSPSEGRDAFEANKIHYQHVLQPTLDDHVFIDSLPTPQPLSEFLQQTEEYLTQHPHAMVGEIGLDKAFRLPQSWDSQDAAHRDEGLTAGGREGRMLSHYRTKMEHQRVVLSKQLKLAGKMGRAVSVHGVQAHGVLHSTLQDTWRGHEKEVLSKRQKRQIHPNAYAESDSSSTPPPSPKAQEAQIRQPKPYPPRICLHSFSGAPEVLKQYLDPHIPADVFFSFSSAVNLSTAAGRSRTMEVLKEVPKDRVLVESDLHRAGEEMDERIEEIARVVCEGMGWGLEEGVERLGRNYRGFAFGEL